MSPERSGRGQTQKMEAAAERLRIFRARYGDPQLPTVGKDESLAFIEIEKRVATALPWAPANIREFIADYLHRFPPHTPARQENYPYMSVFPRNPEGVLQRNVAILASYYGTSAGEAEIAEAFSLKSPSSVRKTTRLCLMSFNPVKGVHEADRTPLYRQSIRKLPQPATFSPQAGIETIKRPEDIWVYHQRHCLPEVEEIDKKLASGDFVILNGPFSVGKTFNIAHQLLKQRQMAGYTAEIADGQETSPQDIIEYHLPLLTGSKRFMVIDEFPSMLRHDEEGALRLLKQLSDQRVEVLLVSPGRTRGGRNSTASMMVRKGADMGINFNIHHFRTTHISPELVRQHLRNINQADNTLIDFVLDPTHRALINIAIFEQITSICRTLDRLRQEFSGNPDTFSLFIELLTAGRGGSKKDLVRVFYDIGFPDSVVASLAERINNIPDYN